MKDLFYLIYIKELSSVFFKFIYIANYKYEISSSANIKTNIKNIFSRLYFIVLIIHLSAHILTLSVRKL